MKSEKDQLRIKLAHILQLPIENQTKITMVEALNSQIKAIFREKNIQRTQTCDSEVLIDGNICEEEIEELENKIMEKRAIKFHLNEDVQGMEEELYQLEKIIETKRICDDRIRKDIDKTTLLNEWNEQKQQKPCQNMQKRRKNKTLGEISTKIKKLFG